jgi:SAM-dependent methyltransferase
LPPQSFDVVWALESICHSDSKQAFVSEAWRLLRPGGRLVVGDFVQFKMDLSAREHRHMRHWLDGWALPHLAGFDEFGGMMRLSGFERVEADDITRYVLHSAARLFIASLPALPIGYVGERLGLRTARQSANVRASFYQYTTMKAGLWGYAIYTAVKPA